MENDASRDAVAYLSAMRKARDRRAVLKLKFVSLRGKCGRTPILAFEGDDDKIVYGRWINRIKPALKYEAFVCKGKNGLRSLQGMLVSDLGRLAEDTYLFVDRDFDDLFGFADNGSVFMTDRYSVENYLVSPQVLESVLRDELACHDSPDLREQIIALFEAVYEKFLENTVDFNWRLFVARVSKLQMKCSLPDKVSEFAKVSLENVQPSDLPATEAVVFIGEVSPDAEERLRADFDGFDRRHRFRGKNAYAFFVYWINLLCEELAKRANSRFGGPDGGGRLRREELSLGTYASKSVMPLGLPEFLGRIAA